MQIGEVGQYEITGEAVWWDGRQWRKTNGKFVATSLVKYPVTNRDFGITVNPDRPAGT